MSDFNIKDTFQKFEEDEFLEAKEDLKNFFRAKTNDHLKKDHYKN